MRYSALFGSLCSNSTISWSVSFCMISAPFLV
nr:MAG TPA: hypothetical protein [Caudoviricetes sp.]DAP72559.1 MAG TPA: hypothetical protein [Caudoviricetes sp.]